MEQPCARPGPSQAAAGSLLGTEDGLFEAKAGFQVFVAGDDGEGAKRVGLKFHRDGRVPGRAAQVVAEQLG